jgi:hypothetical protein
MMRALVPFSLLLLILVMIAGPARADRVVLRNGGTLTGEITRETADEIELTLSDGMRMTISRSRVRSIVRESGDEPETPEIDPVRPVGNRPPTEPDGPVVPEVDDPPGLTVPRRPGPFENPASSAWNRDFSRHPLIMAAKTTPFRSYACVRRTPLAVDPSDKRYVEMIRRHGHGGSLAVWEFQYTGVRELRYGDQVRFIAEITSPTDEDDGLIRLKQGPTPVASRMAVFLARRDGRIERFATTTKFESRDFKQDDLARISEFPLNVRTFLGDYTPIASNWLRPADSNFLAGFDSRMADSVRVQILQYRFRLDWFKMLPEDRPPLDADLISRNSLKPLAKPGRPVATASQIQRHWGSVERTRKKHNDLVGKLRVALSGILIKADRDYIVEMERVGVMGNKGVSIQTKRYRIAREMMEDLLTPR